MKYEKQIFIVVDLGVTFFASCNDDDDDKSINVPEAVTQALKQKYPNATT